VWLYSCFGLDWLQDEINRRFNWVSRKSFPPDHQLTR